MRLPDAVDFVTAAALGCRFATAFRAVRDHGQVRPGQWVAVHGCGGVGLSAVMIATALGARVVAVDVSRRPSRWPSGWGPCATRRRPRDRRRRRRASSSVTGGGRARLDRRVRQRGDVRGVDREPAPARPARAGRPAAGGAGPAPRCRWPGWSWLELSLHGSHGMAAHEYGPMLEMVADGALRPDRLVSDVIGLDDAPAALAAMSGPSAPGTRVIVP